MMVQREFTGAPAIAVARYKYGGTSFVTSPPSWLFEMRSIGCEAEVMETKTEDARQKTRIDGQREAGHTEEE
jgi:hypothetical protein